MYPRTSLTVFPGTRFDKTSLPIFYFLIFWAFCFHLHFLCNSPSTITYHTLALSFSSCRSTVVCVIVCCSPCWRCNEIERIAQHSLVRRGLLFHISLVHSTVRVLALTGDLVLRLGSDQHYPLSASSITRKNHDILLCLLIVVEKGITES
jgi:hypothetical protein